MNRPVLFSTDRAVLFYRNKKSLFSCISKKNTKPFHILRNKHIKVNLPKATIK